MIASPSRLMLEPLIRTALLEDLGLAGDITTDLIVPPDQQADMALVARQAGVVAWLEAALLAFALVEPRIVTKLERQDGERVAPGQVIARLHGPARGLLVGERVALNLLCHLSGVATATRRLVDAVAGTKARIACTRKTLPGLRALQKHAVRAGGGVNHRFGLHDAILIKDNHIAVAGGVRPALERARAGCGHLVKIEIEVDTLAQLDEVLAIGADVILLDNMPVPVLRDAVRMVAGQAVTEASGGVTPETVRAVAETGVDVISSGWITHSAPVLDIGLDEN